jgi:hypothetical protein
LKAEERLPVPYNRNPHPDGEAEPLELYLVQFAADGPGTPVPAGDSSAPPPGAAGQRIAANMTGFSSGRFL